MDQLQGMRVFARVADLGSFAKAAETLDLSRAMASSYVAQLEKHLGTRLLHRTTRKVSVSPEGAVYLEHCKRILAEIDAADDLLRLARNRPQGKLRVDVPIAFGKHLLLPALPRFTQRYPELALEVRFNDHFVDLVAERVDVAVRAGPVRDPDLIAKKVATSRMITCASPDYLSRAGIPRTPDDLRKHRLIGYLRSDATRANAWRFRIADTVRDVKLPFALSFNSIEPLGMSAFDGQGIVQLNDLIASHPIAQGKLVEVLRDYSCEGPTLNVVYPRATQHLAKVRVFAEFAAELLRGYEARLRRPEDTRR
jgi:LysR family transcriptional regulator, regulator for bpeEF and oprC